MAGRRLGFWRRFAVTLVKTVMTPLTRREWRGGEHVPPRGGVILVANHVSHFDPFVVAHFVYDAAHRWPAFLAKASLFRNPVIGYLLRAVHQTPVHRGTADAARALDAAIAALRAGESVIIYPEGTTSRDPDLWPMRGKTGVARLVVATGAPVIPITVWGAQRVYDPRTGKLRVRPRTPVTVVAGPPVDFTPWTAGLAEGASPGTAALQEMTDAVMLRLRDELAVIRGEPAPPLWGTPERRAATKRAAAGGVAGERATADEVRP